MSTGAMITMILVLGLVWGGFVLCLVHLARSSSAAGSETESHESRQDEDG